eukprot:1918810-Pyramimonas_sp.AAC.1
MVAGSRAGNRLRCVALRAESAWPQVCALERPLGPSRGKCMAAGWQAACTLFGPLCRECLAAGLRAGR